MLIRFKGTLLLSERLRNSYVIVDLNAVKAKTLKIPCFLDDFEGIFAANRDRYIISQWLNKIGDKICDTIYGIQKEGSFIISQQEYRLRFLNIKLNKIPFPF